MSNGRSGERERSRFKAMVLVLVLMLERSWKRSWKDAGRWKRDVARGVEKDGERCAELLSSFRSCL